MINKINKFALLLCLFCLSVSISAADEAQYSKLTKAYTLNVDGSQEFRYNMELTLNTHTAMNGTYGESFILYNPLYQELKIHTSYTKQKDGNIVKTPDNGFVEVLPRSAADAPAFNGLKEMVVVHTGLELGSTIYLDYSVLSKPGYNVALDINEMLQETSPVKEYSFYISVPDNTPLQYQLYGSDSKVKRAVQNGMQTVSCTLKNVPAQSRELFQPQNRNEVPRLVASTYASQADALETLNKRFEESNAYECKTFGAYLTEKAANDKEKVTIILNHVVNNMGTCAVTLNHTGYTVRNADDVLRSAYGTPAEKTQLLCTLLNAAGVKAEPVAIYPATLSSNACGLSPIKELVVKISADGQDDQFLSAVSLASATIGNRGELDKLYTLDGKEIQVTALPVQIVEAKEVAVKANQATNGYVVCQLPTPTTGVDRWNMTGYLNSLRTGLFELPSMIKEEITYTVKPEAGLQLQTPLCEISISKPCGKVIRTLTQKGDEIEVVRAIELNKLQLTPAEYNDFRQLLNEWSATDNQTLLFSVQ